MTLSWTHLREVERVVAACRTAGAEGRLFPVTCADAGLRRTFETAVGDTGPFRLELHRVGGATAPGGPWPEPLREHAGDHYNKVLWCLEGAPEDGAWFAAAEARRPQACKPGTWVVLWLSSPETARLCASRAPLLWRERVHTTTLWTPSLAAPPAGWQARPEEAAALAEEGREQERAGDPERAVAVYAQALRHDPGHRSARRRLADLLMRLNERQAGAAVAAALPPDEDERTPSNGHEASRRLLDEVRRLRRRGDLVRAEGLLDEAHATRALPLQVLQERGRLRVAVGVGAARAGDEGGAAEAFDDARLALADAFNLARTAADVDGQADVAMDLADLNFRAGAIEAALTSLDVGARLAEEAGRLPLVFDIVEARRTANSAAGNHAGALGDIRKLESLARSIGLPELDARLFEAQGDQNQALDIPGRAASWWDRAAALWRSLERLDDAARCAAKTAAARG